MKKLIFPILLAIFFFGTGHSQIYNEVVPTSGGVYTDDSKMVSWTVGDFISSTIKGGDLILTQGFNQAFYLELDCDFMIQENIISVSERGEKDGNLQLNIREGFAPYNVEWSNADTGFYLQDLSVGRYFYDITDLSGCENNDSVFVWYAQQPEHSVKGLVNIGDNLIDDGIILAYLVKNNEYYPIESVKIVNGGFLFSEIIKGTYLLYCLANNELYSEIIPVYYVNKPFMSDANLINITGDITFLDLYMQQYEPVDGNNFYGSIQGKIFYENDSLCLNDPFNKSWFKNYISQNTYENCGKTIPVLLLDKNKKIVAYTLTNENGEYEFEHLPYGDYTIDIQKPGYDIEGNFSVSINEISPNVSSNNYMLKTPDKTTHVFGYSESVRNSVTIYPNPVKDYFVVNLKISQKCDIKFEIVDVTGSKVYSNIVPLYPSFQNIRFNVEFLQSGIYYLHFIIDNEMYVSRICKTEN